MAEEQKKSSLPIILGAGAAALLGAVVLTRGQSSATAPPPTSPPPTPGSGIPIVETLAATDLTIDSAELNGTVDPNGGTLTDCYFDVGFDTSYGTQIPCS